MSQPFPSSRPSSPTRRKALLWFVLLCLLSLAGFSWLRAARPSPQLPEDGYYEGHLANGRTVYFLLKPDGAKTSVTLHVASAGELDILEGKRDARRQFVLKTAPYADAAPGGVSKMTGSISGQPAVFSGTLIRGTAHETFSARYVAKDGHFQRKQSLSAAGRGGGKEFSADWPDFIGATPFHRAIAQRLAAEARGETDRFMAGALGNVWEGVKGGGASWDYDGVLSTQIIWLSPTVVSLFQDRYQYTGGAHGMTNVIGRNFVLQGQKVKELALPDLFRPGAAWTKTVSAACMRDLRRQKASSVLSGDVKRFAAKELANFTMGGGGLTIHFDPYIAGCGAEGTFHVVIPWRELRALLNPSGPAKYVPGALDRVGP